jgi:thiol-disulfide isomerase/thioredoxin
MKTFALLLALGLRTALFAEADILSIANQGQEIVLANLLRSNAVTVVSFHAEWCGPCKAMNPFIEALAKSDANLRLVRVDIDKFGSPVCQQFQVEATPDLRVFLPDGTQVGDPVRSMGVLKLRIKNARRSMAAE